VNGFVLGLAISFGLLMFIVVPFVIARFIYLDAKKRALEGALGYALMAFFIPFYLGIALYLFKIDAMDSHQDDEH